MQRFQSHFSNITARKTNDTIGHHFNKVDHNGLADVTIDIVNFIHLHPDSKGSVKIRLAVEHSWQHRQHTIDPHSLNIQE